MWKRLMGWWKSLFADYAVFGWKPHMHPPVLPGIVHADTEDMRRLERRIEELERAQRR